MTVDQEVTHAETEEEQAQDERSRRLQRYAEEIEPKVIGAIPEVREEYRGWLGWMKELLPSHTDDETHLAPEDRLWLDALAAVCHRHGLTYELIGDASGPQLWLIPPPPEGH